MPPLTTSNHHTLYDIQANLCLAAVCEGLLMQRLPIRLMAYKGKNPTLLYPHLNPNPNPTPTLPSP